METFYWPQEVMFKFKPTANIKKMSNLTLNFRLSSIGGKFKMSFLNSFMTVRYFNFSFFRFEMLAVKNHDIADNAY